MATVFQGWREFHGVEFSSENDSKAVSLLYCFSTIRNGRKLLSMKSPSNDGEHLPCLHGMRFLSTCWIAVAHTYLKTGTFGKPSVINPNTLFTVWIDPSVDTCSYNWWLMVWFINRWILIIEYDEWLEIDDCNQRVGGSRYVLHHQRTARFVFAFQNFWSHQRKNQPRSPLSPTLPQVSHWLIVFSFRFWKAC